MTIEELNECKRKLGYTNQYIADLSGVPVSTVNKILSGATKHPRRSTLNALKSALSGAYPQVNYPDLADKSGPSAVEEPGAVYQVSPLLNGYRMGPYTLEDYMALPDEERKELIDGYFYDLAAPAFFHQHVAGLVYYQLMAYVEKNGGPCLPAMSPVDVQIDMSDKTVVQPDVMIICRPKDIIKNQRVYGAPDFIMEVLSPSTRIKDMTIKLNKYYQAGVREYWVVDPDSKKILVYDLEHDNYIPAIYDFTEKVPVLIWEKKASVDFSGVENLFE